MCRLFPLVLLSAGCTINVVAPLPETEDSSVDVGDSATSETEDADGPGQRDGGRGEQDDASTGDGDASGQGSGSADAAASADGGAPGSTLDASAADAAGSDAAVADAAADAAVCGPNPLRKQAPELRIVLDRSNSMRPVPPGLDCRNPTDSATINQCLFLGTMCTDPLWMNRAVCGGPEPNVDYWTPAVAALKAYTAEQAAGVDFGLTVFPGGSSEQEATCSTGAERVPVGPGNAVAIANALDGTQPMGYTPTSSTLAAIATQIDARKAQLGSRLPPQYVLLITDGSPNCIGNAPPYEQAHQATLAAIDALAALGVKTWVAGFGSDAALARQLQEYAEHGGTSSWYPVQGSRLPASITDATREISACSYALDHELAATDVVTLDGQALTRDAANGFVLRGTSLQLVGAACSRLRETGTHTLSVAWSCTP
ncbi:MAG TPA: hypothetical protein VFZ61_03430 [Polyangiales bacterium]